jgi:hypothetical protein
MRLLILQSVGLCAVFFFWDELRAQSIAVDVCAAKLR